MYPSFEFWWVSSQHTRDCFQSSSQAVNFTNRSLEEICFWSVLPPLQLREGIIFMLGIFSSPHCKAMHSEKQKENFVKISKMNVKYFLKCWWPNWPNISCLPLDWWDYFRPAHWILSMALYHHMVSSHIKCMNVCLIQHEIMDVPTICQSLKTIENSSSFLLNNSKGQLKSQWMQIKNSAIMWPTPGTSFQRVPCIWWKCLHVR